MFQLLLEPILKNTNKGVVIVDSGSQIELVSDRVEEYLGIEEDVVGLEIAKIELGSLFKDLLQDQASIGSLDTYESRNYTVDFAGEYTYITPKASDNMYKIEVVTDDTSDKGAIIIEKDIEPDYQQLLELNSDIIAFIYSLDNVELRYVKNRDMLSKDLLNNVHYEDLSSLRDAIRSVYEGDADSVSVPCRVQINNKWRVYKLSVQSESVLVNISHSIITGDDITDQYLSEQRRLVINRILRHDIRNDMNVIKGYAEMLVEDDIANDSAEKIAEKSDKLIRLTNEIREIDQDLYRVDHRIKRININTMLRSKVQELQKEYSNVSVRLDLCSENKVIANQLIESAIRHIIKNGIIHNTSDTKELYITSTYEKQNNLVSIVIEDNGPGIDMSVKKIIESGVETPLKHTTGLGLWIVKWIIELVDGQLSITNRKGQDGTQVNIKLHHESADIEDIKAKNKLKQSDFDSLPGLSDSESNIRTTTRSN